jgi:hypothetical protein
MIKCEIVLGLTSDWELSLRSESFVFRFSFGAEYIGDIGVCVFLCSERRRNCRNCPIRQMCFNGPTVLINVTIYNVTVNVLLCNLSFPSCCDVEICFSDFGLHFTLDGQSTRESFV